MTRLAFRRMPPVALVLLVAGLALLVWLGYGLLARTLDPTVRGLITSVQARDIGHAQSLTVRTLDGRELSFQADPKLDMTPGHMRDHMTFGEPVTVHYRRQGDALVAVNVTD